jgi:hypothetical protein
MNLTGENSGGGAISVEIARIASHPDPAGDPVSTESVSTCKFATPLKFHL